MAGYASEREKKLRRRANKEAGRLRGLLFSAGVPQKERDALESVIVNTAWIKEKLEDARLHIADEEITVSYNNGGGQRGVRENPAFKAYESLWRAYLGGVDKILAAIKDADDAGEKICAEDNSPAAVLSLVLANKRAQA